MRFSVTILGIAVVAFALVPTGSVAALSLDDFISVTDPAETAFFQFCVIEGEGLPNAPQSELDLLDLGLAVSESGGSVLFEFVNASSTSSAIADIYFDDAGTALIENGSVFATAGSNVSFSVGPGSPPDLPAGNNLDPNFDANPALSAHAANPVSHRGINPGENLVLAYDSVIDFDTVVTALFSSDLRIGMHVQSIGNSGESDAFIAKPYTFPPDPDDPRDPVPEPATVALLGLGTAFLAVRRRHFA